VNQISVLNQNISFCLSIFT